MEQRSNYQELFRGDAKKVGYFLDQALQQTNPQEFFRMLAQVVVSAIAELECCKEFNSYIRIEEHLYQQRWDQAYSDLYTKIRECKESLKRDLLQEKLLANDSIQTEFEKLEKCFDEMNSILPAFDVYLLRNACEQFTNICYLLISMGRVDLIEGKYAQGRMISKSAEVDGSLQWVNEWGIESLIFGDLIEKLFQCISQFSWNNVNEPYIAWVYIKIAADYYSKPEGEEDPLTWDDLKIFGYEERLKANMSIYSYEMKRVKEKVYSDVVFFTLERFKRFLRIVGDYILRKNKKNEAAFYSLQLGISEANILFLIVRKYPSDDGKRKKLKKFNGGARAHKCMVKTLNFPHEIIDIRSYGYSVSKLRGRMMPREIWDLHYEEIDGERARLKENPVILENRTDIDHIALKNVIDKLPDL